MISKDQITAAKKSDLPSILVNLGVNLIRCGNGYQLAEHDSLKFFKRDGVWLYKWWSQAGEVGDGIQYLQRHLKMDFLKAIEILSQTPVSINHSNSKPPSLKKKKHLVGARNWKSPTWQKASERLIQLSRKNLLGPNGEERISYLMNERGLWLETIKKHRLGWLPDKDQMPSKIVIPCYSSQKVLVRIRFRIDQPSNRQNRYRILKGSNPDFPFPLGVNTGKPLLIVESELDAILVAQECKDQIGVLGLGSTGTVLPSSTIEYLSMKIPYILISLDNDKSGKEKTIDLIRMLPNAINWPIPESFGKDPGEAWKRMDIKLWIEKGLDGYRIERRCNLHR
ncbi:toprim domain-containing protein [Desulfobacterales bacterium HSG17]|nr:toprim domain-containing protein [Desulfobacterales bacterium HSG17]